MIETLVVVVVVVGLGRGRRVRGGSRLRGRLDV
jgi:hypothetical protein